jgi:integrase
MPPRSRPPIEQTFVPYVYTHNEVRLLLRATSLCGKSLRGRHSRHAGSDFRTFHIFLLTLYATGMRTGEALGLRPEDVDVSRGVITIQAKRYTRPRSIPNVTRTCISSLARTAKRSTRMRYEWRFEESAIWQESSGMTGWSISRGCTIYEQRSRYIALLAGLGRTPI